jgi:hypothetical protein
MAYIGVDRTGQRAAIDQFARAFEVPGPVMGVGPSPSARVSSSDCPGPQDERESHGGDLLPGEDSSRPPMAEISNSWAAPASMSAAPDQQPERNQRARPTAKSVPSTILAAPA